MSKIKRHLVCTLACMLVLVLGILTGCGRKPEAADQGTVDISIVDVSSVSAEEEPEVVEPEAEPTEAPEEISEPEEVPEVTAEPEVTEEPAEEPASAEVEKYYFRNRKLLGQHYEKHGIEMGFASEKEYEAAASAVITNPDVMHKTEKEDGDEVYYVEATNEFVVLSKDGYIRTYFNPSAGIKYYNRQ